MFSNFNFVYFCDIIQTTNERSSFMSTRKFRIEDKDYCFNFSSFKYAFTKYRNREKLKVAEAEQRIADKLYVSSSAVHNWCHQKNGISDLDAIKKLADLFDVDYMILLEESREDIMKEKYTDLQIQSIKRIYDEIIEFLFYFSETNGFSNLWIKYENKGVPKNLIESTIYEFADTEIRKIGMRLQKEFFYLRDLSIYDTLYDFVDVDLVNIYDRKCGYDYRFEEIGSTDEDYLKAMNKLNDIVKDEV